MLPASLALGREAVTGVVQRVGSGASIQKELDHAIRTFDALLQAALGKIVANQIQAEPSGACKKQHGGLRAVVVTVDVV